VAEPRCPQHAEQAAACPDGQVMRCRVLSVDEDGSMQVVPEHEVVIG
jgi:hypothetical protein